jgi:antitoxin component of MazEF toxin-antitoxin module
MTASSDMKDGDKVNKVLANKSHPIAANLNLLAKSEALNLENLVGKITPENCHIELEFGLAVGAELL